LSLQADIIRRLGGDVDKFVGDGSSVSDTKDYGNQTGGA